MNISSFRSFVKINSDICKRMMSIASAFWFIQRLCSILIMLFWIFPEPIKFFFCSMEIWSSGSLSLITFFRIFFFNSILLPLSIQMRIYIGNWMNRQSFWFFSLSLTLSWYRVAHTFVKSIQPTIILDFRLENTCIHNTEIDESTRKKECGTHFGIYACSHLFGFLREWWLKVKPWQLKQLPHLNNISKRKKQQHVSHNVVRVSTTIYTQSVTHSIALCWLTHTRRQTHIILLMPKPNETTFRVIYRWAHQIHWFMNMAEKISFFFSKNKNPLQQKERVEWMTRARQIRWYNKREEKKEKNVTNNPNWK